MAAKQALLLATLAAGLAGCGWMSEDQRYYIRKDWEDLKDFNWAKTGDEVTGFSDAFPSPTKREQLAEQQICLHKNGDNRVVMQNGISDKAEYRHCVLTPYPTGEAASGLRMHNRPEPQG